jgi:putative SOS response-associated peptidase YedK
VTRSAFSNVVLSRMCNLYSITTNQAAIIALFRVVNRYVGNLAPMPGVFSTIRPPWSATPATARGNAHALGYAATDGPPVTNIRNTSLPHWRM